MTHSPKPPPDTFQIRCPRLGHQIHFSYCRTENLGRPCPRIILCWQPYFGVAEHLRRELTATEWQEAFVRPVQPKVLTLVELIEQAQRGCGKGGNED